MCQLCNDSLLAAANAANLLANAAKQLYAINQTTEANVLAKAAADLFSKPKVSGETDAGQASPNASKGAPEDVKPQVELPKGFDIDPETGIVSINGVAIGRAVLVRRPAKH